MGWIRVKPGIFKLGDSWKIDKVVEGEQIRRTLPGCTKLSLVEQILAKEVNDIVEAQNFPGRAGRSLTVESVLNFYWQERIEPKIKRLETDGLIRKVKHIKDSRFLLTRINDYFGTIPIRTLTIAQIEQYKAKRLSETTRTQKRKDGTRTKGHPVHPRSVNRELDLLNVALNWSVKTRRIQLNPIAKYEKIKEGEPKKIVFDHGEADGPEWQDFYKAVSPSHKDIFLALYETGCRPSEVFDMRWEWLNPFARSMTIPAIITKTGLGRQVPISEKLWKVLESRERVNEYVFPNPETGKPFQNVTKAFRGAITRAELQGKGLTVYAIRRTRLTAWNQIDPVAAMQAAGHSLNGSIHYKHYVNISESRVLNLVAKAG